MDESSINKSIRAAFDRATLNNWHTSALEQTVSTMEDARAYLEGSELRPAIFLAAEQTCGRGQQGRQWHSAVGGFYATYVLPVTRDGAELNGFSLIVGLVLVEVLARYSIDVMIKWPNDVLSHEGKKLAGILTELRSSRHGHVLLVGIGINVTNLVDTKYATSTDLLGAKNLYLHLLAASIATCLLRNIELFQCQGMSIFLSQLRSFDYLRGKKVIVNTGIETLSGVVDGISDRGALLVRHIVENSERVREIWSGHIERIEKG